MIHVSIRPNCMPWDIEKARVEAVESIEAWTKLALEYYAAYYNFAERDDEESDWLQDARDMLKTTMPKELRTGVHRIGEGVAFMGENVYVVDGNLDHYIHRDCVNRTEDKYHPVLSRQKKTWCTVCNDYVEILTMEESHNRMRAFVKKMEAKARAGG